MLVTVPFLLLVLDSWPLGRLDGRRTAKTQIRLLLEKAPLFALSTVFSVGIYLIQTNRGSYESLPGLSFSIRAASATVSYATYLIKLLWPHPLSVFSPHPQALPE